MRIPTTNEGRAIYASEVMAQAVWDDDDCTNVEIVARGGDNYSRCRTPKWDWNNYDYRIVAPPQVRYSNVYEAGFSGMYVELEDCVADAGKNAIDRIRITGIGPGTRYESLGLDAKK